MGQTPGHPQPAAGLAADRPPSSVSYGRLAPTRAPTGRLNLILVGIALAGLTLASRLPFLTPRLAHWDAVNYALGLHTFNVAAHQPHPPGSPYYILLGRM